MITKIIISQVLNQDLKDLFMKLQSEHRENLTGIYDLYNELYASGKCESYSLERIYYVAYTLAAKGIKFNILKGV